MVYANDYDDHIVATATSYHASFGVGTMFWFQRFMVDGSAMGESSPTENNAVCPADDSVWKPYTWTPEELDIYNTSYGSNPVAMIYDLTPYNGSGDGVHDWSGAPYQGRRLVRFSEVRHSSEFILISESRGDANEDNVGGLPWFDPWLPNTDNPTANDEWAWERHGAFTPGDVSGGSLNILHADGHVSNSAIRDRVNGIGTDAHEDAQAGARAIIPEGKL